MKPRVFKIEKIGTGILYAMAKPMAGEWIEEEFIGIANLGVHRVV